MARLREPGIGRGTLALHCGYKNVLKGVRPSVQLRSILDALPAALDLAPEARLRRCPSYVITSGCPNAEEAGGMTHKTTEAENLRHQMEAVKASIRQDWHDLSRLSKDECVRVRKSADELIVELAAFIERLDQLKHPE